MQMCLRPYSAALPTFTPFGASFPPLSPTHSATTTTASPTTTSSTSSLCFPEPLVPDRPADCLVLVVDASRDLDHLRYNRSQLHALLADPRATLEGAPLLVLANKSDLAGALSADRCAGILGLEHTGRPFLCVCTQREAEFATMFALEWLYLRSARARRTTS
jgi:ADP-ribosylation factor family